MPAIVSARESTAALKAEARRLGFELVGVAPAVEPTGIHEFLEWLERGYAGDMGYLPRRAAAHEHPRHVLDGVRSVIMLGMNYNTVPGERRGAPATTVRESRATVPEPAPGIRHQIPGTQYSVLGTEPRLPVRVARYAQGACDYHDLIRERLERLAELVRQEIPGCQARGIVDTAPLLERDFARLAGLGWFGKNTMLIDKRLGSWFFLAGLLTDAELAYDEPHEASHCGTCTRCLDACPTGAFVAPYVLDARKCISYLTIEHRGPIPEELRAKVGDWLFGCDICQEVCPWNRKAPATPEPAFQPRPDLLAPDAAGLLSLSAEDFRAKFGESPLSRPKRAGLMRNAAIVLGNSGDRSAVEPLRRALHDADPIVREAAAWALAKLDGGDAGPEPD